MVYYELNFEESLLYSLEAFRHFVSNSRLLPAGKLNYYTLFYKSVKKLISLKNNFGGFRLKSFLGETENSGNFINRKWVINKALLLDNEDT